MVIYFAYHYQVLPLEMRRFVVLTKGPYIIHKDCAKLLLDNISNSKIFRYRPVDHYILQVLRFYKKDIFSSYPLLCYSPLKGDSDIR